jgi:hypothetical protein
MSSPPTTGIGTSSSSSRDITTRANDCTVNRDASELRRSHPRKAPASDQPDPMHVICTPGPRELSRSGTRTATDTVRRKILTCANVQERLHYDEYSARSSKRAWSCRGRASPRRPASGATARGHLRSTGSFPERRADLLQTSYGNTVASPKIVKPVAPHTTVTGQTGAGTRRQRGQIVFSRGTGSRDIRGDLPGWP